MSEMGKKNNNLKKKKQKKLHLHRTMKKLGWMSGLICIG